MKVNGFNILEFTISNVRNTMSLTDMFLSCELVESVFIPFVFGEISILDTLGIDENFPLIGNEDIFIKFQLDNSSTIVEINLKLYKFENLDNAQSADSSARVLKLYACSKSAILNKTSKISRSFNDTPSNIITELFTNILLSEKLNDIYTLTDKIKFISNYWTSVECFKYICEHSKEGKYVDFIIFETLKKFRFVPLSFLLEQKESESLTFKEDIELITSYSKIRYFNQKTFFDLLDMANSGNFGKTLYNLHSTEYSYTKEEQTLTDAQNEYTTLGSGNQFNIDLDSKLNSVNYSFDNIDIEKLRSFSIFAQKNYNVEVNTSGNTIREVGQNLLINFKTFDNESETNEFLNGKWFLHTMKHIFTVGGKFEQNCLLTKNAFLNTNNKITRIEGEISR